MTAQKNTTAADHDTDLADRLARVEALVTELLAVTGGSPGDRDRDDGSDRVDVASLPPAPAPLLLGVSLHDCASWLPRPIGTTPSDLVRRWARGRRDLPSEIGIDCEDGRRKLVHLGQAVRFVAAVECLDEAEIRDLRRYLRDRLRTPR